MLTEENIYINQLRNNQSSVFDHIDRIYVMDYKITFGNIPVSKIVPTTVHDRIHELNDNQTIEEYCQEIPPIILKKNNIDGLYYFDNTINSDGNHRLNTLLYYGIKKVPAIILKEKN